MDVQGRVWRIPTDDRDGGERKEVVYRPEGMKKSAKRKGNV